MNLVQGDITNVTHGVICHQVNCRGIAGGGLALQIKRKFPGWYENYIKIDPVLGKVGLFEVNDGLVIANLYAQVEAAYGATDYDALRKCLMWVGKRFSYGPVFVPYGIGCGLGGGDWEIVRKIVEEMIPNAVVVKLPRLA